MNGALFAAGGYSGPSGEDIVLFRLTQQGDLQRAGGIRQGDNPSFLCASGRVIYALSEQQETARIYAYRADEYGLTMQGRIEERGRGLCHLAPGENVLYGSCYGDGTTLAVDYSLSKCLWRHLPKKGAPHAHWAEVAPKKETLFTVDLGLDELRIFPLSGGIPQGEGRPVALAKGIGPRQVLFFEEYGVFAVVCELGSRLLLFGVESCQNIASLPATGAKGESYPGGAARAGNLLFLANRGADTIAVFLVEKTGLTPLGEYPCGGRWPRHIYTDGRHLLVACQHSGVIVSLVWEKSGLRICDTLPLFGAACILPLEHSVLCAAQQVGRVR